MKENHGFSNPRAGAVGSTRVMEREKQDKVAAEFSLATRGWPKVALILTNIVFRG